MLAAYDLTLDQAAVIAEFDDGTPDSGEAVKLLTVTAQKDPRQFEHVTQRLRDDRADARAVADRIAELTTAGIRVLDPDAVEGAAQISGLRPEATDPNGAELTPEAHAGCPGHAAQVEILAAGTVRPTCGPSSGAPTPPGTDTQPAGTASATPAATLVPDSRARSTRPRKPSAAG